jgi:hypothetical protein
LQSTPRADIFSRMPKTQRARLIAQYSKLVDKMDQWEERILAEPNAETSLTALGKTVLGHRHLGQWSEDVGREIMRIKDQVRENKRNGKALRATIRANGAALFTAQPLDIDRVLRALKLQEAQMAANLRKRDSLVKRIVELTAHIKRKAARLTGAIK